MKKNFKKYYLLILALSYFSSIFGQGSWSTVGSSNALGKNYPSVVHIDKSGNLYTAGHFVDSLYKVRGFVSKWDGNKWINLDGFNANGKVITLSSDKNNNLYAAGQFSNANGHMYVAKWNGNNWSELGGFDGLSADLGIESICVDSNNNLYAAGIFTRDATTHYVAKFDGSKWSDLGGFFNHDIYALTVDSKNNIYVGSDKVFKFDGASWTELQNNTLPKWNGVIYSLAIDKFGDLLAGGAFTDSLGNTYLAKWDGANWSAMNNGEKLSGILASIKTIAVDQNNDIYVGGGIEKSRSNIVMKWSNNQWSELVSDNFFYLSKILSLTVDKDHILYVAAPGIGVHNIASYTPKVVETGINNANLINSLKVYPNPASTILHIDLEKPGYYTAKLSSVTGQSIISTTTGTVDISTLANGVYILTIYHSNNQLISTNKVSILK
jgi:hypothetical protein